MTKENFEQIIESNKDAIYRFCRIYAYSPIEPQDLFQEVVYQVWKSFPTFKGSSSINTWIYRIALNVCYRSNKKFERRNSKTVRLDSIQFLSVDTPPDKDKQEKHLALQACISTLGESNKAIVILYLEDLPYKEIATITGLTENHIAVKMKRIRKILFECITPKIR